jgi:hypothetical protein
VLRRLAAVAAAVAALALVGCTGETEPATDITGSSAKLHGDVTWNASDEGRDWGWAWSGNGGATWTSSPWWAVPGGCQQTPCSAHVTYTATPLVPGTRYIFRLKSRDSAGNVTFGDSNGLGADDPPYEYDSFLTSGYPSIPLADVDYDADFDAGCQLVGTAEGAWDNFVTNDYPGESSIEQVRVGEGKCSGKFTHTAATGAQGREELSKDAGQPGAEVTYEFVTYVPSADPDVGYIAQSKQGGTGGGCHNGGVKLPDANTPQNGDIHLSVVRDCNGSIEDETEYSLGPVPHDCWFAVKVHEKFATAGFVEAWVDPCGTQGYVQKVPLTNIDTVSDPSVGVKFRLGRYGRADNGDVVYHDGYRMSCAASC